MTAPETDPLTPTQVYEGQIALALADDPRDIILRVDQALRYLGRPLSADEQYDNSPDFYDVTDEVRRILLGQPSSS